MAEPLRLSIHDEAKPTKIYERSARFYSRTASSTVLGMVGYFASLHAAAHPHLGQSIAVTAINTVEGAGKLYGYTSYQKWWSPKQFGRASQEDQLRGKTADKWYRAVVVEGSWFLISTSADCITNAFAFGLACGSPEKGLQFTLVKAGARLAESLVNGSVWGAIAWGKERIPEDEVRLPHPPLYKEAWSAAKFVCKRGKSLYNRMTGRAGAANDSEPEPFPPGEQMLLARGNPLSAPAEP